MDLVVFQMFDDMPHIECRVRILFIDCGLNVISVIRSDWGYSCVLGRLYLLGHSAGAPAGV